MTTTQESGRLTEKQETALLAISAGQMEQYPAINPGIHMSTVNSLIDRGLIGTMGGIHLKEPGKQAVELIKMARDDRQEWTRVLLPMPAAWKQAFSDRAEKLNMSLAEFLREGGLAMLTQAERSRLPDIEETRGRPASE